MIQQGRIYSRKGKYYAACEEAMVGERKGFIMVQMEIEEGKQLPIKDIVPEVFIDEEYVQFTPIKLEIGDEIAMISMGQTLGIFKVQEISETEATAVPKSEWVDPTVVEDPEEEQEENVEDSEEQTEEEENTPATIDENEPTQEPEPGQTEPEPQEPEVEEDERQYIVFDINVAITGELTCKEYHATLNNQVADYYFMTDLFKKNAKNIEAINYIKSNLQCALDNVSKINPTLVEVDKLSMLHQHSEYCVNVSSKL